MKNLTLTFSITGNSYDQVRQYRLETDERIIRNQIERRGSAILQSYRGQKGFAQISEIPKLGEAVPWYGSFGVGYHYLLQPLTKGINLRVEYLVGEMPLICTEILPALEIRLPSGIEYREPEDHVDKSVLGTALASVVENETERTIELRIPADLLAPLKPWHFWGEPLTQYIFIFEPSSMGCTVFIQHAASGENLNLSGDFNL